MTVLPPSRRTGMPTRRSRRAERLTSPDSSGGSRPTFAESARRSAGRRRVAEPTVTSSFRPDTTGILPRLVPNSRRRCHHRAASRVPNKLRRRSNHRTSFGVRVSPTTDGAPNPVRPEGQQVSGIGLLEPFPMTVGWFTSEIGGTRLSGAQRANPKYASSPLIVPRATCNAIPRAPHECRTLLHRGSRLLALRCSGENAVAGLTPKCRSCRSTTTFDEKPTERSSHERSRTPTRVPELAPPLLNETYAMRSPIVGAHRSEHLIVAA